MTNENEWGDVTPITNGADEGWDDVTPLEGGAVVDDGWGEVGLIEGTSGPDYFTPSKESNSGVMASMGAAVDTIQGGFYQAIGETEKADEQFAEARKYEPTVKSYKDVKDVGTAFSYATELLAGGVPYAAAALPAAVAATVGAPVAVVTGAGLLGTAALATTEAGRIYNEQETKDVGSAVAAGTLISVMERVPGLGKLVRGSPLVKAVVGNVLTEPVRTVAQTTVEGVGGKNLTFSESMVGIDEAIVGGYAQRSAYAIPNTLTKLAPTSEPKRFHDTAEQKALNREVDSTELMSALTDENRSVETVSREVDRIWQGREMDNTAEAAQRLQDRGAELTPTALDIETSLRGKGKVNLAKELGVSTAPDKLARFAEGNFNVPLVGSLGKFISDPKAAYASTQRAYAGLKQDFDVRLKEVIGGLGVPKEIGLELTRDIQHYVMGRKPSLAMETKSILARMQGGESLNTLDNISQMKRMRQMTENMKPSDQSISGVVSGLAGVGLTTAMNPVAGAALATGSAMASLGAGIVSAQQKSKLKALINDTSLDSDKKLDMLLKLLGEGLEKASVGGIQTDISEEVEEKVKPDMGTMELVK